MEIRIDSVEGHEAPRDTFVSMRVGEYQKQCRFGSAKTYRFPQIDEERRFARLEVFQRIGHLTVNLDNLSQEPLEVPVDLPLKTLPMQLAIVNGESKTDQKAKQQKSSSKVDAAQKYLAEHHVEEVIADAIREVIREKPSDPHAFLSAQILKHAAKKQAEMLERNDNTIVANDVVDQSAPKPAVPPAVPVQSLPLAEVPFAKRPSVGTWLCIAPKKLATANQTGMAKAAATPESSKPKAGSASLADFRQYYSDNMRSLGSDALDKLYLKFPTQPKPEPKAPAAKAAALEVQPKFAHRPSVGTWLNILTVPSDAMDKLYSKFPTPKVEPKASEVQPKFANQPTWVNICTVPSDAMDKLYSKFPTQPKPEPKTPAAKAAAFEGQPKVGHRKCSRNLPTNRHG
eukprot:Skav207974  [mRNA]  locus=scaffold495:92189:93388:+ [translate_table: standard]